MNLTDTLINALAGLGEAQGQEDQERLWEQGDAGERREVLRARVRYPEKRRAALLAALADHAPRVREEALRLLGEAPPEVDFVAPLAGLLADPEARVRRLALEVALVYRDERLLPGLAPFLDDPRQRARVSACIRACASQSAALVESVLACLDQPEARVAVLRALRYPHRLEAVLRRLLGELDRDDPATLHDLGPALACFEDRGRVRQELRQRHTLSAAYAMAYLADPELRPDLEAMLFLPDPLYAIPGVLGLELMGARDAVEMLRAMLDPGPPPDEDDSQEDQIDD